MLSKLIGTLTRAESFLAATGLILVAAVLLLDLVGREFFGSGVYWAPRLASYSTTVAGMLAFSIVVSAGGHLRPSAIDKVLPRSWDRNVNRAADLISAGLCSFLAYHAGQFVYSTYLIGTSAIALEIPVWYIQLVVPYVFVSAALRYLAFAISPGLRPIAEIGE